MENLDTRDRNYGYVNSVQYDYVNALILHNLNCYTQFTS